MGKRNHLFGVPLGQWLTVLIIVALMCAILYPTFQHVREYSGPSCLSNMKQLGLALDQYEQNTNGMLPAGTDAVGNGWAGQIYEFAQSKRAYHCQKDASEEPHISYAMNRNIIKQSFGGFTAPTGTVALYEVSTPDCDPSRLETVSATGLSAPQDSTRHDTRIFALNFLLADDHVKYLTPGQVSGGANAVPPTHKGKYLATFAVK